MWPKVIVIVINWNGKMNTFECLRSLEHLKYPNYEVIVVDNASTDGSQKSLKENFPEIALIENKRNLGFGGGLNVGVIEAIRRGAEYVLCLNSDVVVGDAILTELVKIGQASSGVGGLCPMEYYYDDPKRINCAGGVFRLPSDKVLGRGELDTGRFNRVMEISLLSGPAMMLKAAALLDIGLFDETYFYGPEDRDIALRLITNGYKILFVPTAKVWHKRRGATGRKVTSLSVFFQVRNYLLFVKKHTDGFESLLSFLFFAFLDFPFTFLKWFFLGKGRHIDAALKGIIWHINKEVLLSDEEMVKILSGLH